MKYYMITLKGILENNKNISIVDYGTLDLYCLNEGLQILYEGTTDKPAIYINCHTILLKNQIEITTTLKKEELENYILHSFAIERDVEMGLLDKICSNSAIDSLMEYMNTYLSNPIILYDRAFHVLAYTKTDIIEHHFWKDIVIAGGIEELNEETNSNFLSFSQSLDRYSFPTFVSDDNLLTPFVISNIYYKNKRISSMCVAEYHHKITSLDLSRIFNFSKFMSFELQKSLTVPNADLEQQLLLELMNGKQLSENQLTSRLKKISFIQHMCYKLYCVDSRIQDYTFLMIKHKLKNIHGSDYIFCNTDKLYFLASFDKEDHENIINTCLNETLKELNVKVYSTGIFQTLNDTAKYYKQLDIVKKYSSNQITSFDSISMEYILTCIFDYCGYENAIPNTIRKLHENDVLYQTEYCKTLLTYINKHLNQRETAELLHIHRSTLLYRLDKIRNDFKIDIYNEDDFFKIYLGLLLLARENKLHNNI